jgi:CRISPR-associated protein Csy1
VDELIDMLLEIAASIQRDKDSAGWSRDSDLPEAEQLWLDPYRGCDDEDFAQKRADMKWREEISQSFAHWLNNTIDKANRDQKYKSEATLKTGEDEFKEWQKLTARKLNLLKEDLEAGI